MKPLSCLRFSELRAFLLELYLLRTGVLRVTFTQELMLNSLKVTFMMKLNKPAKLDRMPDNDISIVIWDEE